MNDTTITTPDGFNIPLFSKHYSYFLNKSIILYGSSGSGKSIIMRDIMYTLKDHIPNIVVIAPTNYLNKSFNDIVPSPYIFNDVTEDLIQKIFKRQKVVVKLYNMVNDYNKLETIYNKIAKNNDHIIKHKMIASYKTIKQKFEENQTYNIVEKKIKLKELEDVHKKALIDYYKKIINRLKAIILTNPSYKNILDDSEIQIIKCLNINPNLLLILDDCAYNANVWCKYSEIKEIFMNGRHHKITVMISFQDDKLLDSGLRKNAFINIFTTEIVCNAFFQRSANNFTKQDRSKMSIIAKNIFNSDNTKTKNYKKFVYIKDLDPNVYYMVADYIEEFKFGFGYLHNFVKQIQKNNNNDDDNISQEIHELLNNF